MRTTILLVEDSDTLRQLAASTLQDAGYRVIQARDGEEGLLQLQRHTPALIISDLNMPHMDGLTFIRTLRQQAGLAHTPVIMLTTELSEEKKRQARQAGATAWLGKPLQPPLLRQAVGRLLGRPATQH